MTSEMPVSFASLGVPKTLTAPLSANGIDTAFPIQVKTLPDTLAGRDVLGRGRTGSGKTLAFSLPLVARLAEAGHRRTPQLPRGLVLAPTRELANQINTVIEPLAAAVGLNSTVIYGGVSQQRQDRALRAGVDIVVACPGRLEDLMKQGLVNLEGVQITVLDEADHMADLGFLPVVKRLLDRTPGQGQRMLFSATLDNGVDKIVNRYLSNPLKHSVDAAAATVTSMEHHVLAAADAPAKKQLVTTLASGTGRRILFMRTKHHARKLAKTLTDSGIPAVDLHGNLSQNARDRNLAEFSSGEVNVLVATDVAARGVHVDDIELVIHVDPPTEHKAYLHRSGRTARAGSDGVVVTLTLPEQEREVKKLMRAAGVNARFDSVTATSPVVEELVGEVAEPVDPEDRAKAVAAKREPRGGGQSTGANARRKRARRSGGAGRGAAAAESGARREDSGRPSSGGSTSGQGRGRGGQGSRGQGGQGQQGSRGQGQQGSRSQGGQGRGRGGQGSRSQGGQGQQGSRGQGGQGQQGSRGHAGQGTSGRPGGRRTGARRAGAPASNARSL